MAMYLLHRPAGAEHLRNYAGLHGALVDVADAAAARAAANALAPDLSAPFAGFTAVLVADTASVCFINALIQGDVVGNAYAGARRGA